MNDSTDSGSLENTSKEANSKVLDVAARVSNFIQENSIYNINFKRSSDSDDDLPKKTISSSNSDDYNDEHNCKKYVDNKFWKK
jgi:hypothetical protein